MYACKIPTNTFLCLDEARNNIYLCKLCKNDDVFNWIFFTISEKTYFCKRVWLGKWGLGKAAWPQSKHLKYIFRHNILKANMNYSYIGCVLVTSVTWNTLTFLRSFKYPSMDFDTDWLLHLIFRLISSKFVIQLKKWFWGWCENEICDKLEAAIEYPLKVAGLRNDS